MLRDPPTTRKFITGTCRRRALKQNFIIQLMVHELPAKLLPALADCPYRRLSGLFLSQCSPLPGFNLELGPRPLIKPPAAAKAVPTPKRQRPRGLPADPLLSPPSAENLQAPGLDPGRYPRMLGLPLVAGAAERWPPMSHMAL